MTSLACRRSSLNLSLRARPPLPPARMKLMPGFGPEITLWTGPEKPLQVPTPHSRSHPIPGSHPSASSQLQSPPSRPPFSSPKALATSPGHVQPPSFKEERAKRRSVGAQQALPLPWGDWELIPIPTPQPSTHPSEPEPNTPLNRPLPPPALPSAWEAAEHQRGSDLLLLQPLTQHAQPSALQVHSHSVVTSPHLV